MRPWRGRRRGPCLPPAQADCNCGSIDFCALACGSTPQAHGAYSSGPISPNLASRARVRGQQNPWSMHRSCRPLPSKPPPRPRPPTGSQRGEPTADPKSGAPGRRPWRGRRRGPCLPPAPADCHCGRGCGGALQFLCAGARAHTPAEGARRSAPHPRPPDRLPLRARHRRRVSIAALGRTGPHPKRMAPTAAASLPHLS